MAHYRTTVHSPAPAGEVYAYLSDFATVADWDPGIRSAELIDGEPGGAGSRYRLVASVLGVPIPLEYEILEAIPPSGRFAGRVVLEAITPDFRSYDLIIVEPTDDGCNVTYDADLALRGIRRPFDPVLRLAFKVICDRARTGLASAVLMRRVA